MLVENGPGIFPHSQGADPVVPFLTGGKIPPVEVGKFVVVGIPHASPLEIGVFKKNDLEIRWIGRVCGLNRKGGEKKKKEDTQRPEDHPETNRCVHGSISSFASGGSHSPF
jgi:hypothetical protein